MNINKKAFSFVEIIIVVSIVVLLAIVSINMTGNYKEKANNTKILSDTDTLKNSFLNYFSQEGKLPLPGGNNKYFKDDGSYGHSGALDNFGVSGFVTSDILPKAYLNYLPIDPKTNQFYAYGKTLDDSSFEIASVIYRGNLPETKLDGTYNGTDGTISLIREYNGPSFVTDGSKTHFPYNPEELLLTAKISSYALDVTINGSNQNIDSTTLVSGDRIVVPAGGYAEIYFSDGSSSMLADDTEESKLILTDMSYTKKDNLATKIKLMLTAGSLWTDATALSGESEFDVFTQDASAAVRGTSFGVKAGNGTSNVTVEVGNVDVGILNGGITTPIPINVPNQTTPIGVNINDGQPTSPNQNNVIARVENPIIYINNIKPYILKQVSESFTDTQTTPTSTLTFENRDGYTDGGDPIVNIKVGENIQENTECTIEEGNLVCNNVVLTGNQEVSLCKTISLGSRSTGITNCTQSVFVSQGVNFGPRGRDDSTTPLPPIVCNPGQKGFYYGLGENRRSECVETDPALTASGFELVAYAPYDIENDFNLYLPDGSTGAVFDRGGEFSVSGLVLNANEGTNSHLSYNGGELENIVNGDFTIEISLKIPMDQSYHYLIDGGENFKFFEYNKTLYLQNPDGDIPYISTKFNSNFNNIYIKNENGKIYMKLNNGEWKDLGNLDINLSNLTIAAAKLNESFYMLHLKDKLNYIKIFKK